MRVFVIGGTTVDREDPGAREDLDRVTSMAQAIGRALGKKRHDLVICSPFPDSADRAAFEGIKTAGASGAVVEIHYPDVRTVTDEIATLAENSMVRIVRSPSSPLHFNDEAARRYAWLLAQLRAFDSCTAAIAIGGRDNRSAAMLLRLSEGRVKPILPLPSCGGAAATEFHRRRFELEDSLGRVALERLAAGGSDDAEYAISQLEILGDRQMHRRTSPRSGGTFFISYARARPAEADHCIGSA